MKDGIQAKPLSFLYDSTITKSFSQQTADEMAIDFHQMCVTSPKANLRLDYTQSHSRLSRDDILAIGKTKRLEEGRQYAFLERGNAKSGLEHIIDRHGLEFINAGIRLIDLPGILLNAAAHDKDQFLYRQGRNGSNPRVVYAAYNPVNGEAVGVALSIGTNGYIVGANPASIDDKTLLTKLQQNRCNPSIIHNKIDKFNLELILDQLRGLRAAQVEYSQRKFNKHPYGFRL